MQCSRKFYLRRFYLTKVQESKQNLTKASTYAIVLEKPDVRSNCRQTPDYLLETTSLQVFQGLAARRRLKLV
ncbi:MAG: hypothetical protein ACRC62_09045 [Microcoleus sp.]